MSTNTGSRDMASTSTHTDNFYARERQRRPLPTESSSTNPTHPSAQEGSTASATNPPSYRRASLQSSDNATRPSMPQRSVSSIPTAAIAFPEPTERSLTGQQPARPISKLVEKATDPRKRSDRNSPPIPQPASFVPRIASPLSTESPRRLEHQSVLDITASTVSSPVQSDDVDMLDDPEVNIDELTSALIQFGETFAHAEHRKIQKIQARQVLDEAVGEDRKAQESLKNYPSLREQTSTKRRIAELTYKDSSKQYAQASESRTSKVTDLASVFSAQINKASEENARTWRTELTPWTTRLETLEQSAQSKRSTSNSVAEMETLLARTKAILQEADTVREIQTNASDKLRDDVCEVLKANQDLMANAQDFDRQSQLLRADIYNFQRESDDIRRGMTTNEKQMNRIEDINSTARAEITQFQQQLADLWTVFEDFKASSATKATYETLQKELDANKSSHASKADLARLRGELMHRDRPSEQSEANSGNNGSLRSHSINEKIQRTWSAQVEVASQAELKAITERVQKLENEVATLHDNDRTGSSTSVSDPFSQSEVFGEYVKRYERDMGDVNYKIDQMKEAHAREAKEKDKKHQEQILAIISTVQGLAATIEEGNRTIAKHENAIAEMQSSINKLTTPSPSSEEAALMTKSEMELRSVSISHSQKLSQLEMQINHVSNQLQTRSNLASDPLASAWKDATDEKVSNLLENEASLAFQLSSMEKQIASSDHSIKALTARYNNLSSESFSRRMANHINQIPAAMQAEQYLLKQKLDSLQSQHEEGMKSLDLVREIAARNDAQIEAEKNSRCDFEAKIKTKYYDVLEDETKKAREDIKQTITELRSDIDARKDELAEVKNEMDELRKAQDKMLLNSCQMPATQKPSPPPDLFTGPRGLSIKCRSDSQSMSQRSLADRITAPVHIIGNGKRRSYEVEDTITAATRPTSPRKKPKPSR